MAGPWATWSLAVTTLVILGVRSCPADGSVRFSEHLVRGDYGYAYGVACADLDGDGRPDIVATADDGSRYADGANEMRWWRNLGADHP